jgi:hypothetical protein
MILQVLIFLSMNYLISLVVVGRSITLVRLKLYAILKPSNTLYWNITTSSG